MLRHFISHRFLGLTILLVGCGSSEASAPDPERGVEARPTEPAVPTPDAAAGVAPEAGTVPPTGLAPAIDAFGAALAGAVCQRVAACCSTADRAAFFQQYTVPPYDLKTTPSEAECVATLTTQLGKLHKKWAASAALGRITFDATRGQSCVAGISAAACGIPLSTALFDAKCFGTRGNEVFTKITPVGATCADIKDGTFFGECDPKFGFCGSAQKCEAWRKTGQDCSIVPKRLFCAPSLSCEGGSASTPGKCTAEPITRLLGETCGATSGPLELCAAGTYCDATNKCAATKPNGAACAYDEECTTFHPYSCVPFGAGTCGNDTFCNTNKGSQ